MNCSEISELLPLYLTGELDKWGAMEFASHLEDCPACADEARQQAAFDAELRAGVLAERTDSGPIERRVMQNVRIKLGWRGWQAGFAAVAASAMIAIGAAGYRAITHATPVPGVYAAAARDHRMEIVERQPRRWRMDAPSIHEMAERQGIAVTDFAALASAGYRLQEGKLCKLDGQIFLHLVYIGGQGNYSLYLRHDSPTPPTKSKRIRISNSGADHVAGFQAGSLSAMCVTEQPGDAALRFARAAAAVI